MADVSQNISAQLFVKELPPTAVFTGCKQDFNSPYLTTCVDNVESDVAVENAFQSQLNLSEYYKSQYVFDTMKRDYMSKTMDSTYETAEVNLNPQQLSGKSTPQITSPPVYNIKESFGSMDNRNMYLIVGVVVAAAVFYYLKTKNKI